MEERVVRRAPKAKTSGPLHNDGRTAFLNDTLDQLAELDCLWCNDCHQKFGRMAYQGRIVDGCRTCWQEKRFFGPPPQNFAPYVKAMMLARKAEEQKLAGIEPPPSGRSGRTSQMETGSMRRRMSLPGRMPDRSPDPRGAVAQRMQELQALAAAHNAQAAGRRAEGLPSATRDDSSPPQATTTTRSKIPTTPTLPAIEGNSSDRRALARRSVSIPEGSGSPTAGQAMQRRRSLPSISAQEAGAHDSRRPLSGVHRTSSPAGAARRSASPAGIGGSKPRRIDEFSAARGGPPMSQHLKNVADGLIYFLYQVGYLTEEALRGIVMVDGEGLVDCVELGRSLRKLGCMIPATQLQGLLRSLAIEGGNDIRFSELCHMITAHAKSMGYGDAREEKPREAKLAFEPGTRVRSLVSLSLADGQHDNEQGIVEGPGPTSATLAVRLDLTNEVMFMKASQLAKVDKTLVRRNSFSTNRRRTL